MSGVAQQSNGRLTPYLTPLGAWAFALGTAIGWGSLVVTSNTYLLQAGPWGSLLGLAVGAAIMIIIARNYHYLINRFPKAGGAYTYVRETFGYDHGFLTAWFLGLTYAAVFWANATSLPLFARYFLGNAFQFGFHYTVFGYEVYLGEALLTIAAIAITALFCIRSRRVPMYMVIVMAIVLTACITVCFVGSMGGYTGGMQGFEPGFLPDNSALSQVIIVACVSPWAFIGFENISNMAEEYAFAHKKVFRILVAAVLTATVLYAFVLLLSSMAYPPQYDSWFAYLSDLGNLQGIQGLPAFYAAYVYLGDFGVDLLMLALLGLIGTSLIGNMVALSRLLYAMAQDSIVRRRYTRVSAWHTPAYAIVFISLISLVIPFLGRTAIGWIVDVTTIGATIVYGFVSAAAWKAAHGTDDTVERFTGLVGLVLMVLFGLQLLLPSLIFTGSLEPESYFLFTAWGILGFVFFRSILSRDKRRRFGRSTIVWIGLLSLVVFFSFAWMGQSLMSAADTTISQIDAYYVDAGASDSAAADEAFVDGKVNELEATSARILVTAAILFGIALAMLLSNFSYISRWAQEKEEQLDVARGIVLKDPLTGVKSRHAYLMKEDALNSAIIEHSAEQFALVVCDLNGLKMVNDTRGHQVGDEYIRAASALICETFDHSPVYRVGGDEFVVVVEGRDYDSRESLIQRLYSQSIVNVEQGGAVVAAGLATYRPGDDGSVRAVFDRADAHMYARKHELKALRATPATEG